MIQTVPSVTRSKDDMLYALPLLDLSTAPLIASPPTAKPVLVQSTASDSPNSQHETVSAKPVHASLEASPSKLVCSTTRGATPRVHFSEPRRRSRCFARDASYVTVPVDTPRDASLSAGEREH